MMNRQLCAIVLALVAGFSILEFRGLRRFGTATQSRAADVTNANDDGADIAKQEIALAKAALTTLALEEKQAQADLGSHDIFVWSRRLVEATRKSGATKAEVMREIKEHLARMDQRLEIVKALRQSARAKYSDVLNAEYEALQAKAWLAEAQRD